MLLSSFKSHLTVVTTMTTTSSSHSSPFQGLSQEVVPLMETVVTSSLKEWVSETIQALFARSTTPFTSPHPSHGSKSDAPCQRPKEETNSLETLTFQSHQTEKIGMNSLEASSTILSLLSRIFIQNRVQALESASSISMDQASETTTTWSIWLARLETRLERLFTYPLNMSNALWKTWIWLMRENIFQHNLHLTDILGQPLAIRHSLCHTVWSRSTLTAAQQPESPMWSSKVRASPMKME